MTRTQVLLPDELHRRLRRFSETREISLAEIVRRGVELYLDRHPELSGGRAVWTLPTFDGGGLRVPLERVRELAVEEEASRSLPRR